MPRIQRNEIYAMHSGLALLMDVHQPDDPNGLGAVHVSGSGWSAAPSPDARPLKESAHVQLETQDLVAAGYTVFTLNHRAAPRFVYPAAVEDVQRGVRFVRYHADRFGVDPDRLGAIGGSSGGHLVSLLGVLDGGGDPQAESPVDRLSARVQAVVARAPVTSCVDFADHPFLGGDPASVDQQLVLQASPLTHVGPDSVPFLLIHGDADERVPLVQSEQMARALDKVGVAVELVVVPGAGHGPDMPGAAVPVDIGGRAARWFDRHLGGV
ncbi:MAG: prolyl oligopeptidase family serine peptidase [Candidatus Latescibacteria bacterium]|nr:prolyl oligopeptidase family serine peptidase [Candidatus Latescibacterota bacterium]